MSDFAYEVNVRDQEHSLWSTSLFPFLLRGAASRSVSHSIVDRMTWKNEITKKEVQMEVQTLDGKKRMDM